jgi:hypothetical protein
MAFVRWRGNSAELLTTVYDQGRSRQLRLALLGGAYRVPPEIRDAVTARFPAICVDWDAVEQALTEGPPHERAQTAAGVPNERLEWLQIERGLRYWAAMVQPRHREHADQLLAAAAVLSLWRWGKPDFPLAQPLPGWDRELGSPPAACGDTGADAGGDT